jgi:hypothetical protein
MSNKLLSLGSLCFSLVAFVSAAGCAVADGSGDESDEYVDTTDDIKLDRLTGNELPRPDTTPRREGRYTDEVPATDDVEIEQIAGSEESDEARIDDGSIDLGEVLESLRLRDVR